MSEISSKKELVNRLNRIIGQINAIKANLESGGSECRRDIEQVKAVTNAMKKFAQAYVENHISECFENERKPEQMRADIEKVIHSAFSM